MSREHASENDRQSHHGGIYEEIPFGVWMCNRDGGLRYASDSFLELLGMSIDEASGYGWTGRIAADDMDSVDRWRACIEQQHDWDDEHRIRDPQGNMRTLLARGHAVRDESGQIEHWIGVHLDITKRKEVEQQVKDARNFAEAVIRTTPEPLIVLDIDHRVVTANPRFYRRFESRPEDTEGQLLHELGNGQWDIPALHKLLEEVLKENDSFDEYEVEHNFPDIGRKVMLVSGRRIERQANEAEMIVLAIRDITAARQKEDRLRIVRSTQAVKQERQRLARRLHDHLQQLLIAANMYIGMVQDQEQDKKKRGTLEKVKGVIHEAIDASRNLAVELTPPVLFDAGLMAALQWLADWVEDKHQLHVYLEIEPEVELEDENLCQLLFDTVKELLLNVVKHAQVDSAKVQAQRPDSEWLQVTVEDKGVGCDTSQFDKEHTAAGFGLSTIRHSIMSVGGSVEMDSAEGRGTAVTIRVPLRQE